MTRKGIGWILAFALLVLLFTYETPDRSSWTAWSLPLAGTVIAIDAGHGGKDGGATSASGDVVEKDVTLAISMYLRDFLQQSGAFVIMTREEDKDLASPEADAKRKRKSEDIRNRVKLVNDSAPDFLISIHVNSIPSQKWSGAQTFYSPTFKKSEEMAYLIQDEIKRVIGNTKRVPSKTNSVFLIREVTAPAVLVEVGFVSNTDEAKRLQSVDYQKAMANAIYQGILRQYAGEKVPVTP
ncbi:N-acetylmuramoyl-L-alanine amidase CwlD [Brevibacillus brevis]|uniref:N-acetylmuramoyl-L-alanine amidase CwlD n=1 Tax=Brevibacillus brevis TaxID=1393 RepID=A0ABY9T4U4_BREBE|nr:N-acetylmuramoyl-L-alanine amidase CwlD [Brevibacillus brevis]WNC15112.1 N-acetylmuramoyl-L-alanine amidase CwlD [Brevibacillus brevis]